MLKLILCYLMVATVSAEMNYTFPAKNETTGELIKYKCD